MTLAGITLAIASLTVLSTTWLGFLFLRNPARGFAVTQHDPEHLPDVMSDRYFAMALLVVGAVLYGDFKVIAYLFAVFCFLGCADAWIYHRASKSYSEHLTAGVAGAIVFVLALLTLIAGVPA